MSIFIGSATALITPFNENGINVPVLKELVKFQLENKTDALCILATTGENPTITDSERDVVIKTVVAEADGRVPVIVGTGGNNTKKVVEHTRRAKELGASGALVVTPYYNRTSQEGLYQYYRAVDKVGLPFLVYNVPCRTGMSITPETLSRIAKLENAAGIKEATGDMTLVSKMVKATENEDFDLISGEDALVLPMLALGGKGVIATTANVAPQQMRGICEKFFAGDIEGARKVQLDLLDLIDSIFIETNPTATKKAVELMGFDVGPLRQPLWELSAEKVEILKKSMQDVGLI